MKRIVNMQSHDSANAIGQRARTWSRYRLLWVASAAVALAAAAGCSAPESKTAESAQPESSRAGLFTVPAEQMQHVQLVTVEPGTLRRILRLTGAVAYNGFHTTPVISAVGGPVEKIAVVPGEHVARGQAMLYVSSPDFAQLRAGYLKALTTFNVADKNYSRAKDLFAHHAIAEKDLLDAESARAQAQADLESAQQGLRVLGINDPSKMTAATAEPALPVLAPIGGEVVEQLVAPGQLLQAGTTQCFTISDMSTVWVLANVYEHDLAFVHVGDEVTIQTEASPHTFHGKISYMGSALDPTSRTLQARIVTENPREELKKDMYVTATVEAGSVSNALTVPDAAVLRNAENEPFVYVSAGENQFAQRRITLGQSAEGKSEVTSGLKAGDKVVAQGALFLQFANSLQQ